MAGTVGTEAYQEMLVYLVGARRTARLSQAELAKLIAKPPSFVGKYELGERRLDVVELFVILNVLNKSPTEVVALIANNAPRTL